MLLLPFFEIPYEEKVSKNVKKQYVQVLPRSTDKYHFRHLQPKTKDKILGLYYTNHLDIFNLPISGLCRCKNVILIYIEGSKPIFGRYFLDLNSVNQYSYTVRVNETGTIVIL